MSDATSLIERRWDKSHAVADCKPIDAVRALLAKMERGEVVPDHIIIGHADKRDDGSFNYHMMQAGSLDGLAQYGLAMIVADMIGDRS